MVYCVLGEGVNGALHAACKALLTFHLTYSRDREVLTQQVHALCGGGMYVRMYVTTPYGCHCHLCFPSSLRQADRLLGQLLSFSANPAYSKVPSANRNGMPVFFMPPNQKTPVSSSR